MPRRWKRRQRSNRQRTNSQSSLEIEVTTHEAVRTTPTLTYSSHSPPRYVARPEFLAILKEVGAKGQSTPYGESFPLNTLADLLKKYIWEKQLYDEQEPTVVYCDKDPLGKVFSVTSFTLLDARQLLLQHCFPVGSVRLKNLLISAPYKLEQATTHVKEPSPPQSSQEPEIQVSQVVSSTGNEDCDPSGSVCKNVDVEFKNSKNKQLGDNDISEHHPSVSSGHDTDDGGIRLPQVFTVVSGGSPRPNDSGVGTDMGGDPSFTKDPDGTPSGATGDSDLPLSGSCTGEVRTDPCEGSSSKLDIPDTSIPIPGRGVKRKRLWTEGGLLETRGSSDPEDVYPHLRKRGSSLSLVLDEGAGFPWDLLIPMIPSSDDSEILSVQSKETAFVKDSTDDNWSSGEEVNVSIEISQHDADIDPPFPEEYGVDSDSPDDQSGSSSMDDTDDTEVLEEILVVCKAESDVEWWADSESSGSDSDISVMFDIPEEDKWRCPGCENLNLPLLGNCDRCMETRPDWLPPPRLQSRTVTSSGEDDTDSPPVRLKPSALPLNLLKSLSEPKPNPTNESPVVKKAVSDPGGLTLTKTTSASSTAGTDCSSSPVCTICLSKPKDASIIHGKTGHQVCCYTCAKKLRRTGKPCPVCRRNIQRVIRNFVL